MGGWRNTRRRYGTLPRALHWVMAALVLAALVFIETRGYFPRGSYLRRVFREWHQQATLIAFVLAWLRLGLRMLSPAPDIVPSPPTWQCLASFAMHALFYVLLIVLPILGVMMVQLDGRSVALLGITLPHWMPHDRALSLGVERVHALFGEIFIGGVALHAAAGLWHHLVQRDNTLQRML